MESDESTETDEEAEPADIAARLRLLLLHTVTMQCDSLTKRDSRHKKILPEGEKCIAQKECQHNDEV